MPPKIDPLRNPGWGSAIYWIIIGALLASIIWSAAVCGSEGCV